MPNTNQNLIGKTFGHLTVIKKSKERGTQNEYMWVCRCDCGKTTIVRTSSLNNGDTTSCGHVRLEKSKNNLKFTEDRHLKQLNDNLPITNKTGYKNISRKLKNGKLVYRVSIQFNRKQHATDASTLEQALAARERLRRKWWPNYQSKTKD